jgi:hypothetical protein
MQLTLTGSALWCESMKRKCCQAERDQSMARKSGFEDARRIKSGTCGIGRIRTCPQLHADAAPRRENSEKALQNQIRNMVSLLNVGILQTPSNTYIFPT